MPTGPRPAPPAGTCKVSLQGVLGSHQWVNTYWLNITSSAPAQADLDSLAASINAAWGANQAHSLSTAVGLSLTQLVWTPTVGTEIVSTNATPQGGSGTGTAVSDASAAYVVSWHISAYYRGGHPRSYLPGVTNENVTNYSDISAGIQTNLHNQCLAFLNAINALTHGAITGVQLGTVSFQTGNAWRTPPIFRPFIGVSVSNKLGTQRRRIHS